MHLYIYLLYMIDHFKGKSPDFENLFIDNFCSIWFTPSSDFLQVALGVLHKLKDVFNKIRDFQKPKANTLVKLIIIALVNYDGEKQVTGNKVINLAFKMEKLRLMGYILLGALRNNQRENEGSESLRSGK